MHAKTAFIADHHSDLLALAARFCIDDSSRLQANAASSRPPCSSQSGVRSGLGCSRLRGRRFDDEHVPRQFKKRESVWRSPSRGAHGWRPHRPTTE